MMRHFQFLSLLLSVMIFSLDFKLEILIFFLYVKSKLSSWIIRGSPFKHALHSINDVSFS